MRKYYVPGMITLLLLPLLCYWYIQKTIPTRDYRMIEVNFEETGYITCIEGRLFEGVVFETLEFTGESIQDEKLLQLAEDKIETILSYDKEKKGLVFTFETVPYSTYIKVLTLLSKHRKQVIMYADSIKFSNDEKSMNLNFSREELKEMYPPFELEDGTIETEVVEDKVGLLWYRMGHYKYAIGIGFLILVYCCFYDMYRLRRGRK
ncbi:hypothetical protein [Myroides fluvii]|uniref:hypothetical protein n=1 Tax=Myroides fluvii TaxID=2572594 RepID=UPI00131C3A41|nr:hypothetical protein [Myroides fluvii]